MPIHPFTQQAARFTEVHGITGRAGDGIHDVGGAARELSLCFCGLAFLGDCVRGRRVPSFKINVIFCNSSLHQGEVTSFKNAVQALKPSFRPVFFRALWKALKLQFYNVFCQGLEVPELVKLPMSKHWQCENDIISYIDQASMLIQVRGARTSPARFRTIHRRRFRRKTLSNLRRFIEK